MADIAQHHILTMIKTKNLEREVLLESKPLISPIKVRIIVKYKM